MSFLSEGKIKEGEFASLFDGVNFSVKDKDIKEHWDVEISIKVDVKGLKRVNRNDYETNENYHFIELVNVNGELGWLYGGATHFAFEMDEYWVVVEKNRLQKMIEEKVEDIYVYNSDESLYCKYQREGRKDLITMVKTIDLILINTDIIKKKIGIKKHKVGTTILIDKKEKNRIKELLNKSQK